MTSTGSLLTDILALYLPLALALVMGLLGLFRGVRREAVVSLSIVLGALIVSVWAAPWGSDLHDTFSNFGQQDIQTWLGVIVLVLVCLVIGYGLGSAITPRGPLTAMSRLGGLLIGLGNGAALGGWILRNYYNALEIDLSGSNATVFSAITDNIISRSLIIWAGWFPLVVALIAAIVALTGPFRRAQTVVATPSAQTNWAPSTAPAVAATTPAGGLPTSYTPQQYPQQYPQQQYGQQQQYAQQYPPQFGAQAQPAAAPPAQQAAAASYAPAAAPYPSGQPAARVQDAPPTMPMPTSDLPGPAASGQETAYFGAPSGATSSPPPSVSSTTPTSSGGMSRPDTGPLGDLPDDMQASSSTPAWAQPPDSSWLSAPTVDTSSRSPNVDNSIISRSEAPTMAYPVSPGDSSSSSSSSSPSSPSSEAALINCPRCGALVPGDAVFCTECGNRLKS